MKRQKLFIVLALLLLIVPLAFAMDFTPKGDVDLQDRYSVVNGVDVNATSIYQDGNAVLDTSDSASLSVNSSSYWDGLNTPADINAGDITDDGTYLSASGDSAVGDYNFTNGNVSLSNDAWLKWRNNASSDFVNGFKVGTDDKIYSGADFVIDYFKFPVDAGVRTLVNIPVTASAVAGSDQGYNFKVDGQSVLTVFADADGAGSVENLTVESAGLMKTDTFEVTSAPAACSVENSFVTEWTGDSSTCTAVNDSILNVNSSSYWDGLDSPLDFSNIQVSGFINQTVADGNTRYFSNGCYEKVNSTGIYWIC